MKNGDSSFFGIARYTVIIRNFHSFNSTEPIRVRA